MEKTVSKGLKQPFFMLRVQEPDRKTGTEWTAKVLAG